MIVITIQAMTLLKREISSIVSFISSRSDWFIEEIKEWYFCQNQDIFCFFRMSSMERRITSLVAGKLKCGSYSWFPTAEIASLIASQELKASISGGSATALLFRIAFGFGAFCNNWTLKSSGMSWTDGILYVSGEWFSKLPFASHLISSVVHQPKPKRSVIIDWCDSIVLMRTRTASQKWVQRIKLRIKIIRL